MAIDQYRSIGPLPSSPSSSFSTSSSIVFILITYGLWLPSTIDAIFFTHPLITSVQVENNRPPPFAVSGQLEQPTSNQASPIYRTLITRSLEPLMSAAISALSSSIPHSAYLSSSVPYRPGPYGSTFSRFTSSPTAYTNLYTNQWNILPFSVGQWCDHQVVSEPEYQQCRSSSATSWRAAEHNHEYRTSVDQMRACCFFWSVLMCMQDAVKRRCNDRATLEYFFNRRNELRSTIGSSPYGICSNYPYNAFRCSLHSWVLILAIMVVVVFILVLIISTVWFIVVRKRRKSIDHEDHHAPPTRRVSQSTNRTYNPNRSHQTQVRRVSPSRSPRVPRMERPPSSPHPMQYSSSSRQISL
ncbi:hypothetical protein RDWZM_005029 [Blomia tropicalis]|uniref:Uncharacterized protein n=1 Tax=Blomia tropicalis TaxID=40697 RepID=A0A9Q0M5D7_BLOTA|nr:hypothetical protein RDWZM_005029 [Blomia tropicalis]